MELSPDYVKYQPEYNPEAIIRYASDDVKVGRIKNPHVKETILKAKKHLAALGWSFFYYHKTSDRRELRYRSPAWRTYCSLRTACLNAVHSQNKKPEKTDEYSLGNNRPKKKIRVVEKDSCQHAVQTQNAKEPESKPEKTDCFSLGGNRLKKKIRLEDVGDLYFRRQEEEFFSEFNENKKIGVSKFFLLSKFEAHAGSTIRRPAANIFLEDGRSIFDCQTLLQHNNKAARVTKTLKPTKSLKPIRNDDFCAFCVDGGELVLCDSCTSSFHLTCIGLSRIPDSDHWFCPSCCCGICHEGGIDSDSDQIKCEQCDRKFHLNCLKKLGFIVTDSGHGDWLCSENCIRISSGLKMLSRETIIPFTENLSWRILKLEKDEFDTFEYTETFSKLKVALDVMHECFQPIKHKWSDNDLVEDLVFGRSSARSNLKGFFTAVLERDDEMITVATLRVHGSKVAEIPLVATRFRYRRLGMCRVLMGEIERKLGDLGVERLVLPAVTEMVSTWTTSFGFKVMSEDERVELVKYKLVDFPGTVRCHKMLR
ncbi:increased DNA methylation 1-like [Bidens hawaiensis]|uniref:increased DNA methylation 1-like n=1 Tax=Bidens hawaiensis TaxID=980011 RepID=UPI00404A4750